MVYADAVNLPHISSLNDMIIDGDDHKQISMRILRYLLNALNLLHIDSLDDMIIDAYVQQQPILNQNRTRIYMLYAECSKPSAYKLSSRYDNRCLRSAAVNLESK